MIDAPHKDIDVFYRYAKVSCTVSASLYAQSQELNFPEQLS